MESLSGKDLAALVGGRLIGESRPVGPEVVIDSRRVSKGALFVALSGEQVDGHDFVAAAAEAGAAAALVSHPVAARVAQVVVPDPLAALADLARTLVQRADRGGLRRIGITGSSGKTSTKDLLAAVLGDAGATVAATGSFNNEIGVPLTATRIEDGTMFLVSELGARGAGHLTYLCGIVSPQIGVVLNIGQAHVGEFGSLTATAAAKGELIEALPGDGWAVLNADDPLVWAMRSLTDARVAAWSLRGAPEADLAVWADAIEADQLQRHRFVLHRGGDRAGVALRTSGAHQVANALAAATAALAAGLELEDVADSLSRAEAVSHWRMEVGSHPSGRLVVNDAYNANPDSMLAALTSVVGMRRRGGAVIAVLGDMLELGETAVGAHRRLGEQAAALGVDLVIAVGEFAADIADGAGAGGTRALVVGDRRAATEAARHAAGPADVVLVKASRGIALESVARDLTLGSTEGHA